MRECQSGLPVLASKATKLPPPSPVNSTPPAVASTPLPTPPPPIPPGTGAARPPCRSSESIAVEQLAGRPDARHRLAAEPHRAARIGIGQIDDVEAVVLLHVEQAGVGRIRGRRPVGHAAFDRRDERAGNRRFLSGFGSTTPVGRRPLAQLVVVPYLLVTMCSPVTRSSVKK